MAETPCEWQSVGWGGGHVFIKFGKQTQFWNRAHFYGFFLTIMYYVEWNMGNRTSQISKISYPLLSSRVSPIVLYKSSVVGVGAEFCFGAGENTGLEGVILVWSKNKKTRDYHIVIYLQHNEWHDHKSSIPLFSNKRAGFLLMYFCILPSMHRGKLHLQQMCQLIQKWMWHKNNLLHTILWINRLLWYMSFLFQN